MTLLSDQPNVQNQKLLDLGKGSYTAPSVPGAHTWLSTLIALKEREEGGVQRPFSHVPHTRNMF